jgi:hypothetical protein
MLDSHPEMAIPFESYFTAELATVRDRYEKGTGFDAEALLVDLLKYERFHRWEIGEETVRERFAVEAPTDYASAMRIVYACYAETNGKPRYGDKTPRYVEYVGVLAQVFPESLFVHIIRDGRNVACSYLDAEWGPGSVEEAAQMWAYRVGAGRTGGRELGPHRYMEVRYEKLVERPEVELRRICDFIELSFDPRMERYFERADDLRKGEHYPHRHQRLSLPPTKNVREWRTELSQDDVRKYEEIAGSLLSELGYETVTL